MPSLPNHKNTTHYLFPIERHAKQDLFAVHRKQLYQKKLLDEHLKIMEMHARLNEEIRNFQPTNLQKLYVHYLSGDGLSNHSQYLFPLSLPVHSSIAIARATPSHQQTSHSKVYTCGPTIMHAPYVVTNAIVFAAKHSEKITPLVKQIVRDLRGRKFPAVELFLREVILRKAQLTGQTITPDEVLDQAVLTDKELQLLVTFNNYYPNRRGAITLLNPDTGRRRKDRYLFEHGKTHNQIYTRIKPAHVDEVFKTKALYDQYKLEKAGIGKSTENSIKAQVTPAETKLSMDSLVYFFHKPKENKPNTANCNKASATFLQKAEDLSADDQQRPPEKIVPPSKLGIGGQQRMYVWDPLATKMSFAEMIAKLMDQKRDWQVNNPREAHPHPSMNVHYLAQHKKNLLEAIASLPEDQQEKALTQVLDCKTALGQIFEQRASLATQHAHGVKHFFKSHFFKDPTSQYLLIAEKQLAALRRDKDQPTQNHEEHHTLKECVKSFLKKI